MICVSHSHIIRMRANGSFFELLVSVHCLFLNCAVSPRASQHLQTGTTVARCKSSHSRWDVSFASMSASLFLQVLLCFLRRQQVRTSAAMFWSIPSPIAAFNFYEPVHDHKHTYWGSCTNFPVRDNVLEAPAAVVLHDSSSSDNILPYVWMRIELLINAGSIAACV